MSFANRYNAANHQIDTEGFNYANLADIYDEKNPDQVYTIDWIYIKTGNFGKQPIFINKAGKKMLNMPSHLVNICEDILRDPKAVQLIKDGKVGFTIYTYQSHSKTCYGVVFVDKK